MLCIVSVWIGLDWIGLDERVYEINSVLVDRLFVMFTLMMFIFYDAARSTQRRTLVVGCVRFVLPFLSSVFVTARNN